MKITFIFILILFIDSVNRVYRVQIELAHSSDNNQNKATIVGSERMEVQARKFYSQRNMYLCGFTLFLSLILNRTYMMILDVLRLEEKVNKYEIDTKGTAKSGNTAETQEVAKLKKIIEKKDIDFDTLKKQSEGLQREYSSLSDKYNAAVGSEATPKKDR